MSVTGKFRLTMADSVVAQLTVQTTVGEWRELRRQLSDKTREWPACDFVNVIDDLLAKADKEWWQTSTNLEDK